MKDSLKTLLISFFLALGVTNTSHAKTPILAEDVGPLIISMMSDGLSFPTLPKSLESALASMKGANTLLATLIEKHGDALGASTDDLTRIQADLSHALDAASRRLSEDGPAVARGSIAGCVNTGARCAITLNSRIRAGIPNTEVSTDAARVMDTLGTNAFGINLMMN